MLSVKFDTCCLLNLLLKKKWCPKWKRTWGLERYLKPSKYLRTADRIWLQIRQSTDPKKKKRKLSSPKFYLSHCIVELWNELLNWNILLTYFLPKQKKRKGTWKKKKKRKRRINKKRETTTGTYKNQIPQFLNKCLLQLFLLMGCPIHSALGNI